MKTMKTCEELKRRAKMIRDYADNYYEEKYGFDETYNSLCVAANALYIFSTFNIEVMLEFQDAWRFMEKHPMFCGEFVLGLDIDVVNVDPDTNRINEDDSKNTKPQVWLEHGPWADYINGCRHDINLDSFGDSFEEAIIEMAKRVRRFYYDNGDAKPTSEHYKEDEDE